MSRIVKLTDQDISNILDGIKEKLETSKNKMGSFTYDFKTESVKEETPVVIQFTPNAYIKMLTYVHYFDTEIAWQGTVDKLAEKVYRIDDVFVYPQEVTGATVDADEEGIIKWESDMMLNENEKFNRKHFHGHSHVNMAAFASGTDMADRKKIVDQTCDNGFYIFLIMNKRHEYSCEIYDYEDNKIYDTNDCVLAVEGMEKDIDAVVDDAKQMLTKKTYTVPAYSHTTKKNTKTWKNGVIDDDDDDDLGSKYSEYYPKPYYGHGWDY